MKKEDVPDAPGHEKKGHAGFQIGIINDNLETKLVSLPDRKVNGRQISAAGGFHPASDFVVLQRQKDGGVEDIDLDDLVDIDEAGTEEFFVVRGDRLLKFTVDERPMAWPEANPTEELIRLLAGRDDDYILVQELEGQADIVLDHGQRVNLGDKGVERFKTRPITEHPTTIIVNGRQRTIKGRTVSFEEAVKIAFPNGPSRPDVKYSVTYGNALKPHRDGELDPGQKVVVKRGGKPHEETSFCVTETILS